MTSSRRGGDAEKYDSWRQDDSQAMAIPLPSVEPHVSDRQTHFDSSKAAMGSPYFL